jgi:nitrogen regulatory protein PII
MSDRQEIQAYDGYMGLAGFALTVALVANYAETGRIRHRGEFIGRGSVRAQIPTPGSFIADFTVLLQSDPGLVLGLGAIGASAAVSTFFYDLIRWVVARNLGQDHSPKAGALDKLLNRHSGSVEALVARVEAPIRQTHSVIGNGATKVQILGGHNIINNFDPKTKEYVNSNMVDDEIRQKDFSVAAFNANSGHGSVFDTDLQRIVPISMTRGVLSRVGSVFTWGLDQYANRTDRRISMKYTRILAMDETPKRYVVLEASRVSLTRD